MKLLAHEAAKSTVQRLEYSDGFSFSDAETRSIWSEEEPWRSEGVRVTSSQELSHIFWVNEAEKTVQVIAVIYARRDQTSVLSQLDLQ